VSAELSTRCPRCATVFRVLPAQLAARGGKVRCGRCAQVFDGVGALLEERPAAPGAEPEAEASPQLALFEAARRAPVIAPAMDAANEELPVPDFLEGAPPPPRHRLAWGLAALAALLALATQAAYHYRTELAVLAPEARPLLEAACARLRCSVRLPRRPDLMAIESSDLQAEGRRENVILLNAVIRNRAPFPQELPALELTLTDERDRAVVRRVLSPADYLEAGEPARIARGIAPGAEQVLRVYLDKSLVPAVGYRLYLFFP